MRATALAPQAPILTITLNPALDISTAAAKIVPDVKLRCEAPVTHPGGGGVNVSRAIALMGGQSCAFAALGGLTGQRIADMLSAANIAMTRFAITAETRLSFAATDRASGHQYRYVLPGPEWDEAQIESALDAIVGAVSADGLVVLSGSNPPGVPDRFAAMLANRLVGGTARLIVDTSGAALVEIAKGKAAPVELLRMDAKEAEELAGRPLPRRSDTGAFAAELLARNVANAVIVARGKDGNIVSTREGCWHAEAASVVVDSMVGAGDSFVGGFTLGLARGWEVPDALGLGAAAASATVQTPATELCRPNDVDALFAARVVTRIAC